MKINVLCIALLATVVSSCGTLKEQPQQSVVQREPTIPRLYVVDIPRTEEMIFNNVLPDTMKIIGAYTVRGEGRFLLINAATFAVIKSNFEELKEAYKATKNLPLDRFIGMDLAVSPIGKLSLISERQITEMKTLQEKELARALNEYNKYTLIGESPKGIIMMRTPDGKYVPDFGFVLSAGARQNQQDDQPAVPQKKQNRSSNAWDDFVEKVK